MTKVKSIAPEKVEKIERVLGSDIESSTYEELAEKFDEVKETLENKKYPISLSQESIMLLTTVLLPKVEWVGQQAWDIMETQKLITTLRPDKVSEVSKESIRAMFQLVATNKYIGVDYVSQVSELLTSLAEIIQKEIGIDEQILRDAGFELQAAEMGITPETAVTEAMKAQNKSK